MPTTLTRLAILVSASLASVAATAAVEVDEVIEVRAVDFNTYKAESAKGAMRADIDLLDTPQSVTVIPEIVVDEQLATTLGEVLVNDASVTAGSRKWNREVFSLRGFELSSGSGYLRNGQQAWSHYVHPIETLERIEVLKGPSSMLYGQSAPGGLINMVTKKPTRHTLFDFAMDIDEYGATRFQVDTGGAINEEETLRYRSVLVKQDAEYWREYHDGSSQERDRFLGSLLLDYDFADWGTLSLHYDLTQDKTGIDRGGWLGDDGAVLGDDKTIWDMPWAFTDNEVENYGFDLDLDLGEYWSATLGYNKQQFNRRRLDSLPSYDSYVKFQNEGATDGRYTFSPFDRWDDWQYDTYYVDFTADLEGAGVEHTLLIGANMLEYYYGQLREKGPKNQLYIPGTPTPPKPDLDYRNDEIKYESDYRYYGVYVQDLITFNEQWQLLIGGRYDTQHKDGQGNDSDSFVPRVGAIYHPQENGSIYLSYSESFQPQGAVNNENDLNDKMDLDPIVGESWELGTKWELADGHLMVDAALFDITKTNIPITERLGNDLQKTTQGGEQQHRGLEFSAQGRVNEQWFLMASMMYLDAEYTNHPTLEGNQPVDAPEWSASAWSRFKINDALALNAGLFYVGERFANVDNTISKDGYARLDMGASYKLETEGCDMDIRLNVENLFDEEYLAGGTNTDVTIGDGRNVRLSVQFSL